MSGEWNVNKIARGMTAKQFIEWGAFAQLEPFGDFRSDLRAASIRQMVFNMAVSGKDRKPLKDFVLDFESTDASAKPVQSWQEKKAIGMAVVMAYAQSKSRGPQKVQSSDELARQMATTMIATLKKEP